ncbi:PH domain-containing protein [Streptomyces sp. FH025]|uniref:PH domain-containing protein n=1 Tax=Streptomyces sp. FH025 TaxID=2815937 RepID=UPI001A9DAA6A|nr:PH domain-containing protein [Streptomyces sp. FH025]MBO1413100.1 PH domain-containing protein [Streptomyces sp. FH025]
MSDRRDGRHYFKAPIRYRRTGRRTLILFPTAVACALAFVLAAAAKGRDPVMIALFTAGLIVAYVIAASFVGPFCGSTTVNTAGLTTRTLLRTRVLTWPQVRSFGFSPEVNRGIDHCLIEARLHRGRAVVLPGLVASSADDPEIRSHLSELRAAWAAAQPGATTG